MGFEIEKAIMLSRKNGKSSVHILDKMATERVGMLQQLRQFGGCNTCKHFFEQTPDGCTIEGKCEDCLIVCECSGCIDHQKWEWCGPWEAMK